MIQRRFIRCVCVYSMPSAYLLDVAVEIGLSLNS
jgi:hypothetical protein